MLDCLDTLASISRGPVFPAEEEDALHDASQMEGPKDEETGPITLQPEVAYQFFGLMKLQEELLLDRDLAEKDLACGLSGQDFDVRCMSLLRHAEAQKTGISLSFVIALGSLMTLGSLMSPSLK